MSLNNTIRLCNGSLYISRELYDTYFYSTQSVVLLARDQDIMILPVQQEFGGLLLKVRNARGDRVVHASEFLQQHQLCIEDDRTVHVRWDRELGALLFPNQSC